MTKSKDFMTLLIEEAVKEHRVAIIATLRAGGDEKHIADELAEADEVLAERIQVMLAARGESAVEEYKRRASMN